MNMQSPKFTGATRLKPITKWIGSKRRLASTIVDLLPAFEGGYIEPMVGSGAVFAELWNRGLLVDRSVVLADLNANLIAVFVQIQENVEKLIADLRVLETRYHSEDAEALYYAERELWNQGERPPSRFLFLKATAFNGLWRENKKGLLNAAWGKYKKPKILDEDNLRAWHRVLQSAFVGVFAAPVQETLLAARRDDLVYVDPPYVGTFDRYTASSFTSEEGHRKLVEALARLHGEGVHAACSNSLAALPMVKDLWPSAVLHHLKTSYIVNRDAAGRTTVEELLVVGT